MQKVEPAQGRLRQVKNIDAGFEKPKQLELEGDILLKIDETNNSQLALDLYNKALKDAPNDFDILIKAGKCLDRKRDFESASKLFQRALVEQPQSATAMFRYGWARFRAGDKDEGLKNMRAAVKIDHTNISYVTKIAEVLMREGEPEHLEEA
jgi:tetratricopeptide (TPR) repeat protein